MYLEHFGLKQLPFALTPNTGFMWKDGGHREALNVMMVALRSGEGFVKIVGEVGTGKSLLCRALLNQLGDDFVTAYIPDPFLTPLGVRLAVAEELGLKPKPDAKGHLLMKAITRRLLSLRGAGKRVVIVVDEAQALPMESLEALRLLTNIETETTKLLQVVLLGQPELDELLNRKELRQLKQRIAFSHRLTPVDPLGLKAYVGHRLRAAGRNAPGLFEPAALVELHRATGGVPRLVNILCHKALMLAYGRGENRVSRAHVRLAANDTEGTRRTWLQSLGTLRGRRA